jgi:amino acid transporter
VNGVNLDTCPSQWAQYFDSGPAVAGPVGSFAIAFVSAGTLFFVWDPSGPVDWAFIGQMFIGLVIVGVMGLVFARLSSHHDVVSGLDHAEELTHGEVRGLVLNHQLHLEGSQ